MQPSRWGHEAWLPLLAGLAWFFSCASQGPFAFLLAVVPGVLLLTSGGARLFWPGDPRSAQSAPAVCLVGAIAGIPATDFSRIFWHHGPQEPLRVFESQGLLEEHVAEAFSVVSPLKIDPQVPASGRAIFGGVTDRIVPPDQVRDLYEHWDRPPMVWYQGGHLSFNADPRVRTRLETTLRERLLRDAAGRPREPASMRGAVAQAEALRSTGTSASRRRGTLGI